MSADGLLKLLDSGDEVADLQQRLAAAGFVVPAAEQGTFGAATLAAVRAVQRSTDGRTDGVADLATMYEIDRRAAAAGRPIQWVGRVVDRGGRPAPDCALVVRALPAGGVPADVGTATTAADGTFVITLTPPAEPVGPASFDVFADIDGVRTTLASGIADQLQDRPINLVLPTSSAPAEPEFARLSADLSAVLGGGDIAAVGTVDDRDSVATLASATGWDGRLIAMSAAAHRAAAVSGLAPEVHYSLARAGLPLDPAALATNERAVVETALRRSTDSGLVALGAAETVAAGDAFETFATQERRAAVAPGALDSWSKVAGSLLSDDQQTVFLRLQSRNVNDPAALWAAASQAGLPVAALKLQGKLGVLTRNNAALMVRLASDLGGPDADLSAVVGSDLHEVDAWERLIDETAAAKGVDVADLVPPGFIPPLAVGASDAEREAAIATGKQAYGAAMARDVRIAFPTHVVSRMAEQGSLALGDHADLVAATLADAVSRGYRFADTPMSTYLAGDEGGAVLAVVPEDRRDEVSRQLTSLHRAYQLAPSNESLRILAASGTSALEVAAIPSQHFERAFAERLRASDDHDLISASRAAREAAFIHRRATQVATVTFSFFAAAKSLASSPGLQTMVAPSSAAGASADDAVHDALSKAHPTLARLFGPMDYCECEECQSVLSPAAYLVDLLRFLDPADDAWAAIPADMKGATKPFEVLNQRRGDIAELALTCENTHTVLPTIDIVNEVLEFYVRNSAVTAAARHDTPAVAESGDLLAEPQHVIAEVYDDTLAPAVYPVSLPYELWTDTVRSFAHHAGIEFDDLLDAFRVTDEPVAVPDGLDGHYVREEVWRVALQMPVAEHQLLTDPDPLSHLPRNYGVASSAELVARLAHHPTPAQLAIEAAAPPPHWSAGLIADALGLTPKEFVEVVESWYVNPDLDQLRVLRKLGVPLIDAIRYESGDLDASEVEAFEQRLLDVSAPFAALDLAAVLGAHWADGSLSRIVVLRPTGPGCDLDDTLVQFADGKPASPEVLDRIQRFARLWRRLGWTVADTDDGLRSLLPLDPDPFLAANSGPAMRTAIIRLAHVARLERRLGTRSTRRSGLLTMFGPIPSSRPGSLYERMFLRAGVANDDNAFDDPLGQYLAPDATRLVLNHLPALGGATGLTAEQIAKVLAAQGLDPATAHLDLSTASLLVRWSVLARETHHRVDDLLALRILSDIDPFPELPSRPLDPDAADSVDRDLPQSRTHAFLDLLDTIGRVGIDIGDLDRVVRLPVQDGALARLAADTVAVLAVGDAVARVDVDHALPADPAELTDEMVKSEIGLALPADLANSYMALWSGGAGLSDGQRARALAELSEAGVVDTASAAVLFAVPPAADPGPTEQARRESFMATVTPGLRDRLRRRAVLDAFADLGPAATVEAILSDPSVVSVGATPLLDALLGVGSAQIDLERFAEGDWTGAHQLTTTSSSVVDGTVGGSAIMSTVIRAVLSGTHRFVVTASAGTTVNAVIETTVDGTAVSTTWLDGPVDGEAGGEVELAAGVPAKLVIRLGAITGDVSVSVLAPGSHRAPLAALAPRSAAAVEEALGAQQLARSAAELVAMLGLAPSEVIALSRHRKNFGGFDLGLLPSREGAAFPPTLFEGVRRAAGHRALAIGMRVPSERLLPVYAAAVRGDASGAMAVLATLARRDPAEVAAIAEHLWPTGRALTSEEPVGRLWEALQVVARLGVSVPDVLRWASPAPTEADARQVRDAVRARHDDAAWRVVARSVYDDIRRHKRDALVVHVMHRLGVDQPEDLFDRFLVDPMTEPVVETSRLRLAISAVQLFVQRCLLNLESEVKPGSIDAERWKWMRRYRLWDANRRIFLFPENWLEPEFRDDRSHLFDALQSTLLEGDIDDDAAEDAMFTYLQGLGEIAHLTVVATCGEPNPLDPEGTTLHVIARTANRPYSFYLRRWRRHRWSAWEPIGLKIDSDHVTAAMYRGRLHLFWVTVVEEACEPESGRKSPLKQSEDPMPDNYSKLSAQLSWSERVGGTWAPPRSTGSLTTDPPTRIGTAPAEQGGLQLAKATGSSSGALFASGLWDTVIGPIYFFERPAWITTYRPTRLFVWATVERNGSQDAAVRINLSGSLSGAFRYVSRHVPPVLIGADPHWNVPIAGLTPADGSWYDHGAGAVTASFVDRIETRDGVATPHQGSQPILGSLPSSRVTVWGEPPRLGDEPDEVRALASPFFVDEQRRSLFFSPTVTTNSWTEWDRPIPAKDDDRLDLDSIKKVIDDLVLIPAEPIPKIPGLGPGDPIDWDPISLHSVEALTARHDWVTDPGTLLAVDGSLVGSGGALDTATVAGLGSRLGSVAPVVHSDIQLVADAVLEAATTGPLLGGGLRVVGAAGLTVSAAISAQPSIVDSVALLHGGSLHG